MLAAAVHHEAPSCCTAPHVNDGQSSHGRVLWLVDASKSHGCGLGKTDQQIDVYCLLATIIMQCHQQFQVGRSHLQGVKVDIPALVNDTVGTLACARYGDGMHQTDTAMSLIVGTGAPRQLPYQRFGLWPTFNHRCVTALSLTTGLS